MLRADTTAAVVNDEEKRARAATQVHKVARQGYRFDVAGSAFWAGCDRAITLVTGTRHSGSHAPSVREGVFASEEVALRDRPVAGCPCRHSRRVRKDNDSTRHPRTRLGTANSGRCSGHTQDRSDSACWKSQFSHGMCQLSHMRMCHVAGPSGQFCKAEVVASDPFRQRAGRPHSQSGSGGREQ